MKRRNSLFNLAAFVLCAAWTGCAASGAVLAPAPVNLAKATRLAVYSATRQINSLTIEPDGTLWAATAGGVLRRDSKDHWRKWTRTDGLPSHEVSRVVRAGKEMRAETPAGPAVLEGDTWVKPTEKTPSQPQEKPLFWNGQAIGGSSNLKLGEGSKVRSVPLPPGRGSHITAFLPQGKVLWAALYGDGIWSYDGAKWQRLQWTLPEAAREVTALAGTAGDVWLGTRQSGIWHYDGTVWKQYVQDNEPFDANVQNMTAFNGELWCSTLESGLLCFDGSAWKHISAPEISSNAPRQLVSFQNNLWVRHGGGKVDRWDGSTWKRNALPTLPRNKAYALAADARRLYVGQWGGWSEWDGASWTHSLRLPELQGVIILSLLPDGDNLWIGTQTRGLAFFNRAAGTITWNDERGGLQDDWITAVAKDSDCVYAGTFVGGLSERAASGAHWANIEPLNGQNITAVESGEGGTLYAATRRGTWLRHKGSRSWINLNAQLEPLDTEAQALCPAQGGMWIGTRTGIFFVRDTSNSASV